PPAPVTSSTSTVWPRLFVMRSAMMRAIVSVGPPAENGTTTVTGFAGKLCAMAPPPQRASASAKTLEPDRLTIPARITCRVVAAIEPPDELSAAELVVVVDVDDLVAAVLEAGGDLGREAAFLDAHVHALHKAEARAVAGRLRALAVVGDAHHDLR